MKKKLLFIVSLFATAFCMQGMEQGKQYLSQAESEWYAPYGPYMLGEYKPMILEAINAEKDIVSALVRAHDPAIKEIWPDILANERLQEIIKEKAKKVELRSDEPFHLAVLDRRMNEMCAFLVLNPEGINVHTEIGWTALMTAALMQYEDGVQFLCANGADVNLKDKHGETALIKAVAGYGGIKKRLNIVRLLLDYGADPSVQTLSKQDAYDLVPHEEIKQVLKEAMERKKQNLSSNNSKEEEE